MHPVCEAPAPQPRDVAVAVVVHILVEVVPVTCEIVAFAEDRTGQAVVAVVFQVVALIKAAGVLPLDGADVAVPAPAVKAVRIVQPFLEASAADARQPSVHVIRIGAERPARARELPVPADQPADSVVGVFRPTRQRRPSVADGQRHLRLPAMAVSVDGVSSETDPIPDIDLSPSGVHRASERICGMHVLKEPAEPLADGPYGLSLPVVDADGAKGLAISRVHHLPRQGACGILFLVCVDVYRRHGICQMMADETIVVVVVDYFNLRVADGIWSRIARLADTSGADCVGHLGEPGAALTIAVAARPLHAQPSELVVQEEPVPPAERGILHIGHAVGPVVPAADGDSVRCVAGQYLFCYAPPVVITVFVGEHCPGARYFLKGGREHEAELTEIVMHVVRVARRGALEHLLPKEIREDRDARAVGIVGHRLNERARGVVLEGSVLRQRQAVGPVLGSLVVEHPVGEGVGEVCRPVPPARLPPCVAGDIDSRHPVEGVVVVLGEAPAVRVEAVGSRLYVAFGHIAEAAARHGDVPAPLASRAVICRHGTCRLTLRACGGHGEGRPAQPVVVLHGLERVRPVGVEHRHGLDEVARGVLRTDCTGQCRECGKCHDGKHRHNSRMCLVPIQFPTPVIVRVPIPIQDLL